MAAFSSQAVARLEMSALSGNQTLSLHIQRRTMTPRFRSHTSRATLIKLALLALFSTGAVVFASLQVGSAIWTGEILYPRKFRPDVMVTQSTPFRFYRALGFWSLCFLIFSLSLAMATLKLRRAWKGIE